MKINIGKRLREIRKQKGMTLNELSKKSGVALATLSRIETGKMTGTLESHVDIAKTLEMALPELYFDVEKSVTIQKEKERADIFVQDKKTSSVILTKDIFMKKMLPILVRLERSGETHEEELRRGVEKFIYVLNGKVEVVVGSEKNILRTGATLYFDASRPHFMRNIGNREATCICVVTPVVL